MKYEEDNHYIDRVLNGDVGAYAMLVAKHKNLVFSIAMKILNNREDAEEVAQDCFVKVYSALGTFEKKSKFSTWLYRIVYNASVSRTRKKRIEQVPLDDYVIQNYTGGDAPGSAEEIDPEVQKALIGRAMEKLADHDQLLVTLFYKSDNSIDEISRITGMSASNVKVRLHRIRKKLQYDLAGMMSKAGVY
ncbi:MAG TPA: sigma-70 family RNA polymerase sigma factor [Bacteroidales bacterium]|nr:sigma-70 family RNA polymerase sigma factor [Bacteroidales bacterium]HPS62460.1 sigma-70 family RNA polymerase sigma factor [Bacteroidales bacterium]